MDPVLHLLRDHARLTSSEIAERLDLDENEVAGKIAGWEKDRTILGYAAVLDAERAGDRAVRALIDVRITPERSGGFDKVAGRIARFDQVKSCILMSGGYDLSVIVEGEDLREVATFVSEKLAPLDGVVSTSTHFQLKAYKQNGLLAHAEDEFARLPVAP